MKIFKGLIVDLYIKLEHIVKAFDIPNTEQARQAIIASCHNRTTSRIDMRLRLYNSHPNRTLIPGLLQHIPSLGELVKAIAMEASPQGYQLHWGKAQGSNNYLLYTDDQTPVTLKNFRYNISDVDGNRRTDLLLPWVDIESTTKAIEDLTSIKHPVVPWLVG